MVGYGTRRSLGFFFCALVANPVRLARPFHHFQALLRAAVKMECSVRSASFIFFCCAARAGVQAAGQIGGRAQKPAVALAGGPKGGRTFRPAGERACRTVCRTASEVVESERGGGRRGAWRNAGVNGWAGGGWKRQWGGGWAGGWSGCWVGGRSSHCVTEPQG